MVAIAVAANIIRIVDGKGRDAELITMKCPLSCPGIIMRLNDLRPCHLPLQAAMLLAEGLRAGPDWERLKLSETVPAVSLAVVGASGGPEHYMLGYRAEHPELCYFMISGIDATSEQFKAAIAITSEQRRKLADLVIATLAEGQATRASA